MRQRRRVGTGGIGHGSACVEHARAHPRRTNAQNPLHKQVDGQRCSGGEHRRGQKDALGGQHRGDEATHRGPHHHRNVGYHRKQGVHALELVGVVSQVGGVRREEGKAEPHRKSKGAAHGEHVCHAGRAELKEHARCHCHGKRHRGMQPGTAHVEKRPAGGVAKDDEQVEKAHRPGERPGGGAHLVGERPDDAYEVGRLHAEVDKKAGRHQ